GARGRRGSFRAAAMARASARARTMAPRGSRPRGIGRFVSGKRRAGVDADGRRGPPAARHPHRLMLRAFQIPIGWGDLARRTAREVVADNCLNLAAQLAYYFFLALFPALLFLVAIVSFIPVEGLLDSITSTLARVAPNDVISIVQDQILKIAHEKNGGLLTLG